MFKRADELLRILAEKCYDNVHSLKTLKLGET